MKGDFTRNTFRQEKHYSRVLQQQGRVQLDADWNELNDILLYRDRLTRLDVIGPACGPEENAGFEITAAGSGLAISAGRYYVNGILVEIGTPGGPPIPFTGQPDFPSVQLPSDPGRYRAILDVWERHVTPLDDPLIREVALGGPDTATRTQVLAQVKLLKTEATATCDEFAAGPVPRQPGARGRLRARAAIEDIPPDPCEVPPSAGYRRLENQLYRVEIHAKGGVGAATYKWSRENGSVVSQLIDRDGDTLIISPPGRDENLGFKLNDWLELTDDIYQLHGRPGILVQIASVEEDKVTVKPATLDGAATVAAAFNALDPASRRVRRWESSALSITTADYLKLEDGVEIKFEPPGDRFRSGDYWLVPARTNTGDVEWPVDLASGDPEARPPQGVDHFMAPLALLTRTPNGQWVDIEDCRCLFPPLSDLPIGGDCCCSTTVGDGALSTGDFTDIQEAVDFLKTTDQLETLCLKPGIYRLTTPLRIVGQPIIIKGCGENTRIIAPDGNPAIVAGRSRVTLDNLTIQAAAAEGAVVFTDCRDSEIVNCNVINRPPAAQASVNVEVRASGFEKAQPLIDEQKVAVWRLSRLQPQREVAAQGLRVQPADFFPGFVALAGRNITIKQNMVRGYPAVQLHTQFGTIDDNDMLGGVWLGDGSSFVDITANVIADGIGPGIILGGVRLAKQLTHGAAGVKTVSIAGNKIVGMDGSGIASATEDNDQIGLGDLEEIEISHNLIESCAAAPYLYLDGEGLTTGGIALANGANLRIVGNKIKFNGGGQQTACGVVLEDCEVVAIIDNEIEENGTGEISSGTCVDFRADKKGEANTPLVRDGLTFENSTAEQGLRWIIQEDVLQAGQGSGLRCATGMQITLSDAVERVELVLIGESVRVQALDAQKKEVAVITSEMTAPVNPRTAVLSGSNIHTVIIEPVGRLWLQEICLGVSSGYQAGIAALSIFPHDFDPPDEDYLFPIHTPGLPALVIHGNSVVTPAGQALLVFGVGDMMIHNNVLVSRGEFDQPLPAADLPDLEERLLAVGRTGRAVSLLNYGLALELADQLAAPQSAGSVTHLNPGLAVEAAEQEFPTGRVQFADNQVTLYDKKATNQTVLPTAFLLSFDDLGFHNNQVMADYASGIILADTALVGATIRTQNNRIQERLQRALWSLITYGLYNNTSGNTTTHCFAALSPGGVIEAGGNIVLLPAACDELNQLLARVGQNFAIKG